MELEELLRQLKENNAAIEEKHKSIREALEKLENSMGEKRSTFRRLLED